MEIHSDITMIQNTSMEKPHVPITTLIHTIPPTNEAKTNHLINLKLIK